MNMLNIFLSLIILLLSQSTFGMFFSPSGIRAYEERATRELLENDKKIQGKKTKEEQQNRQNSAQKDTSLPQNPSIKRSTDKITDRK